MKLLSQSKALGSLQEIRSDLRSVIRENYEHRAKSCDKCDTKGACCLDAHFVNVRITRLEAAAIVNVIDSLGAVERAAVYERIENAIDDYGLIDSSKEKFACPLYDDGCIVHDTAKPLPCIHHACYELKEDLPPYELLEQAETAVARLNKRVYGSDAVLLPLPLALRKPAR